MPDLPQLPFAPRPHRPIFADDPPLKLGEILVSQGLLTEQQVAHVLDVQAALHRPFGDLAERLFDVDPKAVAGAWVRQFVEQTREHDVTLEAMETDWLPLLQPRQAWQFRMVPLRREWDHLLVASDAAGLLRAVNFAAVALPMPPCFVLAEAGSLKTLLMRHYPVAPSLADFAFRR